MSDNELDAIFDRLTKARGRQMAEEIAKAEAEIEMRRREAVAYTGGVMAAITEVKALLAKEVPDDG